MIKTESVIFIYVFVRYYVTLSSRSFPNCHNNNYIQLIKTTTALMTLRQITILIRLHGAHLRFQNYRIVKWLLIIYSSLYFSEPLSSSHLYRNAKKQNNDMYRCSIALKRIYLWRSENPVWSIVRYYSLTG